MVVTELAFVKGDIKKAYVSKIAYTRLVYNNNRRCRGHYSYNCNGFPDDNMIESRYKDKNAT
ncbi:hypothetical protein HNP82_003556 [Catenibacillus scindens]|uniref:Uncharacterized protein n=1 Tax=Catenibacillus scindens TaxID=673271 RepID=A0A7W8HDC7_9FIRM|nr:hypothetical protein [Catenibacillus scindens]MBB5266399.1 hypothetical protein [Catenibacillus scindens]